MPDPTAPTDLDAPLSWPEAGPDPAFAARAAEYLRRNGLDPRAIVVALRAELGLSTADASRLASP